MILECVCCGHELNLDHWVFDDYDGPVKCFSCSRMIEVKTAKGIAYSINCKNWYSIRQTMSEELRTQIHPRYVPLRWLDCQMSALLRFKINARTEQSSQHKGNYKSSEIELRNRAQLITGSNLIVRCP